MVRSTATILPVKSEVLHALRDISASPKVAGSSLYYLGKPNLMSRVRDDFVQVGYTGRGYSG